MRLFSVLTLVVITLLLTACGDSDSEASSSSCSAPELQEFKVGELEADGVNCATAAAVSAEASECYFGSSVGSCPEITLGGDRWDCSFSTIGPPGSGGLSKAVCLARGGPEVRFEVQRA